MPTLGILYSYIYIYIYIHAIRPLTGCRIRLHFLGFRIPCKPSFSFLVFKLSLSLFRFLSSLLVLYILYRNLYPSLFVLFFSFWIIFISFFCCAYFWPNVFVCKSCVSCVPPPNFPFKLLPIKTKQTKRYANTRTSKQTHSQANKRPHLHADEDEREKSFKQTLHCNPLLEQYVTDASARYYGLLSLEWQSLVVKVTSFPSNIGIFMKWK